MKKIAALLFIVCGLAFGFFMIPSFMGDGEWNDIISKVKDGDETALTEKVSEIAELSVLDFKYSNATSTTDSRSIDTLKKEVNIPFTKKTIVMTYSGEIRIGVDADKITVKPVKGADGAVEQVVIGLPPLKITSNDIDRDTIEFPLEKNNILNSIKTEDYASLEEDGKKEMAEAVSKNGAMDRAKEELKATITGYLTAMYGDEVKVTFEDIKA